MSEGTVEIITHGCPELALLTVSKASVLIVLIAVKSSLVNDMMVDR